MLRRFTRLGTLLLALAPVGVASAQDLVPDTDIRTSGPVHEAFAQPYDVQPEAGPIVPRQPPEPVPELPPDERPDGDDYQWIPGYWAWEADQNEFLWVSGTWRRTPPDRVYMPGYWTDSDGGWRWVSGYWAPANQPNAVYAPEPPAPLETGPATEGPADSIYIPGYWNYAPSGYRWQAGFWTAATPGRMWITPTYRWTPAGCVFVNGYWDYPLADRGILFAPVAFSRSYWSTPGWTYRPWYTVGLGSLLDCLFYRPRANSFYFGNYFGNRYAGLGYRPWYNAPHSPYASYYRWQHRGNPNWYAGMQGRYLARNNGRLPVPPRTLVQQKNLQITNNINNVNVSKRTQITQIVRPLSSTTVNNVRLTRVNAQQQAVHKASIERNRQAQQIRRSVETRTAPARTARPTPTPQRPRTTVSPNSGNRPATRSQSSPNLGTRPAARTPSSPNKGNRPAVQIPSSPNLGTRPAARTPTPPNKGNRPAVQAPSSPRAVPKGPNVAPRTGTPSVRQPARPSPSTRPPATVAPRTAAPRTAPRAPTVRTPARPAPARAPATRSPRPAAPTRRATPAPQAARPAPRATPRPRAPVARSAPARPAPSNPTPRRYK